MPNSVCLCVYLPLRGFYSRVAFIKLGGIGKTFCKCKGFEMRQLYKTNKELRCGDFVLKQNVQLLDHPSLSYKVAPTQHLQSVSLFSSNGFTRWLPSVSPKMPNKVNGNWSKDVHSHCVCSSVVKY